jgi:hypothetical protein
MNKNLITIPYSIDIIVCLLSIYFFNFIILFYDNNKKIEIYYYNYFIFKIIIKIYNFIIFMGLSLY